MSILIEYAPRAASLATQHFSAGLRINAAYIALHVSSIAKLWAESARHAPCGKRRVDAFGREVVQLLEVGVHHDLLLVRVLERLDARQ